MLNLGDFQQRSIMVRILQTLSLAAVSAALAVCQSDYVYWVTEHNDVAALGCSTAQARLNVPGGQRLVVHRAEAHQPCAQALDIVATPASEIVLLKPEVVADSLLADHAGDWAARLSDSLAQTLEAPTLTIQSQDQDAVPQDETPLSHRLVYSSKDAMLIAVSEETLSVLDQHVTFDTRIQRAFFRPAHYWRQLDEQPDKPEPVFKKPKFNTVVDSIASSSALSRERILQDLLVLTGEGAQPKDVGEWHSRHSSTHGARLAAEWIKRTMEASLRSINGSTCSFFEYSPYFAPNVVCNIPAADGQNTLHEHELRTTEDDGMVLISAHLDSRGTFGETTAPGGDDDGSGTAALLAIARAVGNAGVQFKSPVQLVAFSGEEQGLVGSQKYAHALHELGTPIKLAVQMDMLAYRKPGEPLQIAFPDKLSTKSATAHVTAIAAIYAPELAPGFTPACCSDHQSFWEQGFPATWVFERNGPIADPKYHNSGDITHRPGYDTRQLAAIAKVVTATLLNVAGFYM